MIKDYFNEIKNLELYEEENGFVLFRLQNNVLYLHDFYVRPSHRRSRVAYNMADKLIAAAKEIGCTHALCDVEPTNANSTESVKFILNYGFRVKEANQDEIIFIKEL